MSRPTLAQQLKQLESEDTPSSIDPENAYSNLDSLDIAKRQGNEGREHYLNVGPSRLRGQFGDMGERYGGQVRGRQKIFDDDDEEDEDVAEDEAGFDDEDDEDEDDEGDEEDDDEGEDGEEDDEEDAEEEDEEDEGEEEEEGEENDEQEVSQPPTRSTTSKSAKLDPIASLRDSRQKDVEKGKAIKRQKVFPSLSLNRSPLRELISQAIFDAIVTLRITFQKALTASSTVPGALPEDAAGEVLEKRTSVLKSLGDLNERLFALREGLRLPGTEIVGSKRKRDEDEVPNEEYWLDSARDSFALTDATHPNMLPVLDKWSSKIQAATLQVGSKGSKFLQSTQSGGQSSITEVIQAGISSRKESDKTLLESEETSYRSLLREVIESRSGQAPSDLSHLRREKKKKREAERGGSKGRKLRYTVHEKAQNFVVPIPLSRGWHDEQVDELFGSLFGGTGMRGAKSEGGVINGGLVNGEEGLAELGGLRVF